MSQRFETIQPAQIIWRDGVPYSSMFDDVYFSRFNGLAETEHVFIHANHLAARFAQLSPGACFTIAETGFGTGLNFLTAWHYWRQDAPSQSKLFYYTTELYPLTREDLTQCLEGWPDLKHYAQQLIQSYPVLTPGFHWLSFEQGRVSLILMLGDVIACYEELLESGDLLHEKVWRTGAVDAWFLDGFSPAKNARMWEDDLFRLMAILSVEGTTFSSFTAASSVRNALKSHGFDVALREGCGQKRHMIQGHFLRGFCELHDLSAADVGPIPTPKIRLATRKTPWHVIGQGPNLHNLSVGDVGPGPNLRPLRESRERVDPGSKQDKGVVKHALIIGGGLSGCFMAHALAKRGFHIQLLEANTHIALGGSANKQAILYPKLSAFAAPFTQWMLQAFLYAQAFYKPRVGVQFDGALDGILQFAYLAREKKTQGHLRAMLACYPELARFVSADEASKLAGIRIIDEALYIPQAGWINVPQLCDFLIQHPRIEILCNKPVSHLHFADNRWHVDEYTAPIVVLANAKGVLDFEQTKHLPLKVVGGGLTLMSPHPALANLKLPLCGDGHLMPLNEGVHAIGATYHLQNYENLDIDEEHYANILKARNMPLDAQLDLIPEAYWGDVRVATPDYLPLTGGVAVASSFDETYAKLKKNAKSYIPALSTAYPGLYVCTGFGSRGLGTIPLASEFLAGLIHGEPAVLPRTLKQALSPQRFLMRGLCRVGKA